MTSLQNIEGEEVGGGGGGGGGGCPLPYPHCRGPWLRQYHYVLGRVLAHHSNFKMLVSMERWRVVVGNLNNWITLNVLTCCIKYSYENFLTIFILFSRKLLTKFFNISYPNKLPTNFLNQLPFTISSFLYLFVLSGYVIWCSSLLIVLEAIHL